MVGPPDLAAARIENATSSPDLARCRPRAYFSALAGMCAFSARIVSDGRSAYSLR
jgi:hypothetical protein